MASPPATERAPAEQAPTLIRQESVLIYAAAPDRSEDLERIVESAGWLALTAADMDDAVRILESAPPDVFVLVASGTDGGELSLVDRARASAEGAHVPIVCMLDHQHRRLVLDAFGRRADDVVPRHLHPDELVARLRARIERPPVPRARLIEDPVTGALTSEAFEDQLRKEHERVERGGRPGALAFLSLDELPELTARHGSRARDQLLAQVVRLIKADGRKLDFVGWRRGMLAILLPSTPTKGAQARFDRLVHKIYDREFVIAGSTTRLTPVIGFTETVDDATLDEYEDRAWDATIYEADQLDLHPTRWVSAMSRKPTTRSRLDRWFERVRTPLQVVGQQVAALVLPFVTYVLLSRLGIDLTGWLYLTFVIALAITAASILIECHAAVRRVEPPPAPDGRPPPASAIIAAYLPNEAGTIVETVEAFLQQDYPDLEIILAYNTPRSLEVEDELRAIAVRDPRFVPLRVEGSVSKAQNVNAAMARVRGEFVGLFDADHHPAPGSFHRAWRWLAGGAGVVQGHCVIRNGDTNFVTRLVATEFEAIYAVAHPGRARLHGFGVFGGSNGYWRTSLLHRTRMRGSMLTEDIDSSMRVVQSGEIIISDRDLVSTELAPETFGALWNQRLRWAQGWSQVSLRHLVRMVRGAPTLRQRLGVGYLLGWREVYPWISLQMFPLLAFWWYQDNPPMDWFVPIFVLTSVFTFSVGPIQTWYSYRLAHPSIRRHRRWFLLQGVSALVFYTELKNVMARTAHLKEAMRERKWKVTPRTGSVALDAEADHEADHDSGHDSSHDPGQDATTNTDDDAPDAQDAQRGTVDDAAAAASSGADDGDPGRATGVDTDDETDAGHDETVTGHDTGHDTDDDTDHDTDHDTGHDTKPRPATDPAEHGSGATHPPRDRGGHAHDLAPTADTGPRPDSPGVRPPETPVGADDPADGPDPEPPAGVGSAHVASGRARRRPRGRPLERTRRHRDVPAPSRRRRPVGRTGRPVEGLRTAPPPVDRRPAIYDHEREVQPPVVYDVELETDGWTEATDTAAARPIVHGERRSADGRRGRRATDGGRGATASPPAMPIRLFEPDFRRQTIHRSPPADAGTGEPEGAEHVDPPSPADERVPMPDTDHTDDELISG